MDIFHVNVVKGEAIFGLGPPSDGAKVVFADLEHLSSPFLPKTGGNT